MNNTFTLCGFEIKKIVRQKSFLLVLAAMLAIIIANETAPVILHNYPETMLADKAVSGTIIDDGFIEYYKGLDNPKSLGAVDTFIRSCSQERAEALENAESLYDFRLKFIEEEMNIQACTDYEKKFWLAENEKTPTPYKYEYCGAYSSFFDTVSIMNFLLLISVTVALGGLFADEKTRGTDQLIFSSRNGKKTLFKAKLLAGFAVSLATAFILMAAELVLLTLLYGTEGFNTAFQLIIPPCMSKLSAGQAVAIEIILWFALSLIDGAIVMFLSQVTGNHTVVTAAMILVMILSMINPPESMRLISVISSYLPGAYLGAWNFYEYRLIKIGNLALTNWQSAIPVWIITGAVLLAIAKLSYKKYQVTGK